MLVTGGAGFIGSHLTERLLGAGARVLVLDDLSTGRRENLSAVADDPRLQLHVGSVLDAALVDSLVARADVVIHLAAAVGVRLIVDEPLRTVETNVRGTELVLAAAQRHARRVLLASTSEVYGKSAAVPFREDADLVLGPSSQARWAYACSKALTEWLALAHFKTRGLPVVIVRLFNVVGPRQRGRYGMVLPTFARQALRGEPITVFGSGRQTRCFLHVWDAVAALETLTAAPGVVGEVFNLGSTCEITIDRLAAMVREAASSDSPIVHVPYESAYAPGFEDMDRRVPCIDKLGRAIGFRPTRTLEAAVADVVADRRQRTVDGRRV